MDSLTISTFNNLRQQAIRERYNRIYAHELAHKNAAGNLAGPIVIEKDSNGIPVGGDLEYIDEVTLLRALEGRIAL